ncbi:aminopeptidase C [Flavobacterium sp. '19STA2R22 D10 B1']|uniref:aminopeptidase C n=1 Tax=Flavobacterium aerium TaxID=3037261 RepID=UPI00278BFE5C|nr:C1 family peptidase [Flavobacterium sp. '19STA2R22 D10 B1']
MYKLPLRPLLLASALFVGMGSSFAQDNLVNSLKNNESANSKKSFQFTELINLTNTPVASQGSSGTCWSYSANSFIESEMSRLGKQPIPLSQMYTVRNAYVDKGKNYVRMHGAITLGDGGALHDVINMYKKYGTVPQELYTGLNYGTANNKFSEMSTIMEAVLAAVVKNPNGELTPNWEKAYTSVIDAYLGDIPKEFNYNGRKYTPQSFAKDVVGINPDEYVELTSFTDNPYYSKFTMMVPDNWSLDQVYNVKMNDMTDIIDNALKKGYTVAWATDVSEKGFSWKNGVAYVPAKNFADMTQAEKDDLFNGPKPELEITEELRQKAYDNYQTTDDHGMHIIGLAKDQTGKEYYIVKNSWGTTNDYKGYLYVTKNFVKYKTTTILVNKGAIPSPIAKKLSL